MLRTVFVTSCAHDSRCAGVLYVLCRQIHRRIKPNKLHALQTWLHHKHSKRWGCKRLHGMQGWMVLIWADPSLRSVFSRQIRRN